MTPAQISTLAWINRLRGERGVEPLDWFPPNTFRVGDSRARTCPIAQALRPIGFVAFACSPDGDRISHTTGRNDPDRPEVGEIPPFVYEAQVEFDRTKAWI